MTLNQQEIEKIQTNNLEKKIKLLLMSIGFDFSLLGSHYVKEIVVFVVKNPKQIHCLSSGVMKRISTVYEHSVKCIDKDIRWAINKAYNTGLLKKISIFSYGSVPTIKQLINWLFDYFA